MATAKKSTTIESYSKTVDGVVKHSKDDISHTITLELSQDEAQVIADVLGWYVIGRDKSRRRFTNAVLTALEPHVETMKKPGDIVVEGYIELL